MEPHKIGNRQGCHDVTVRNHERLINTHSIGCELDRSGGISWLGLDCIMQVDGDPGMSK